ncbi:hypothetical protein B834_427 [Enterococcus mundtii 1A]|nr:hypothetical protein [Enterococcus mundtii 1A]
MTLGGLLCIFWFYFINHPHSFLISATLFRQSYSATSSIM